MATQPSPHSWNGKRLWSNNKSRRNKRANKYSWVTAGGWPGGGGVQVNVLTLLYDFFDYSGDTSSYVNEAGQTFLSHEDFTLSIIDVDTGLYPDWLTEIRPNGTPWREVGPNLISEIHGNPTCCPDELPLPYLGLSWVVNLGVNWYQDVDTADRTLQITFTHNDSGESTVHTLTQDGSLAANKTPLNLTIRRVERPTVDASQGKLILAFDANDTFVKGEPDLSDLNFNVELIDPLTGITPTWVTLKEIKNIKLGGPLGQFGPDLFSIDFIFDFEANTTGLPRYFEYTITELNRNESVSSDDMANTNPPRNWGYLTFQPNR